jgi:drug/metabolite transporter (DMT)-like permease
VVIAGYAAWGRTLGERGEAPDSLRLSLITFAAGGVGVGLAAWVLESPFPLTPSTADLLNLLGLGVVATVVPSIGLAIASARLSAVTTTTINLLVPVVAMALAAWLLAEQPSATLLPGAAMVLGGLWLILRRPRSV